MHVFVRTLQGGRTEELLRAKVDYSEPPVSLKLQKSPAGTLMFGQWDSGILWASVRLVELQTVGEFSFIEVVPSDMRRMQSPSLPGTPGLEGQLGFQLSHSRKTRLTFTHYRTKDDSRYVDQDLEFDWNAIDAFEVALEKVAA